MAADDGRQQQQNSQKLTRGQQIFLTADPFTDSMTKYKIISMSTFFFFLKALLTCFVCKI